MEPKAETDAGLALEKSLRCVRASYGLLKRKPPPPARAPETTAKACTTRGQKKRVLREANPHLSEERRFYTCVQCRREVSLRAHGPVICQACGSHVVSKHRLKRAVEVRAV
jgi:DNA-directed RNA polymerase subunit RPC12/RpoP